jgi:cell division protein FtsQ
LDGGGRFVFSVRSERNARLAAPAGAGLVLPRLMRRPVRALSRLFDADFEVPRFAGAALALGLLAATGLYGAAIGGHMPSVVQSVTARTGFALSAVRITGNRETSEIDVLDAVGLDGFTSLIGFDANAARDRIAALPWVQAVTVRKIYPAALEVLIEERQAFAIWQHGSELTVIEKDGKPIAPFSASRHASLPLVVGLGAPERADAFVAKLAAFPALAPRIAGYVRVADRRWDLRLRHGITVRLPEYGEDAALAELQRLDREHGLLSRDIAAIDMRLPDRLAIQLSPDAATAREAAMKERLDLLKKQGRRT